MKEHGEKESTATQGSNVRLWCVRTAQWACAVLWMLCFDDGSALQVLQQGGDLIVQLARKGEATIRHMAIGCIVRLLQLPTTMHKMLNEYNAAEILRAVGRLHCLWELAIVAALVLHRVLSRKRLAALRS